MLLSLKEAETAAYLDPSQENLAVYVKRLEEALEKAPDPNHLADVEADRDMLEEQLEDLRRAARRVLDREEGAVESLAALL